MNWIYRVGNTVAIGARSRVERWVPFLPQAWLARLQRYRLRSIIQHAYKTVPFYRRVMDEQGIRPADIQTVDDLALLPVIDGLIVKNCPDDFMSAQYPAETCQVLLSGASRSYVRRATYWDDKTALRKLAYAERDRSVLRCLVGPAVDQRIVYILPPSSSQFELRNFWQAHLFLPKGKSHHHWLSTDLSYEEVVEQLNTLRPHVVFSYGSYSEHFFRFLIDRHLSVALPRVWVYGADMLSRHMREWIEERFGCHVYSTYQATETGRLGFECEQRNGFHLNVDLCAVRLINDKGKTVQPGEVGEIRISNLHNRAMVLLNYHLGDRGVLTTTACSCGRTLPVLARLEGRSSEVLRLADGRTLSALTLEMFCWELIQTALQIQIVQLAPGQIRWRLVPGAGMDCEAVRPQLQTKSQELLGTEVDVQVECVEHIASTPQGKFLKVVSH